MSQTQHAATTVAIHATRCDCFIQARPCEIHDFYTTDNGYIGMSCDCSTTISGASIGHYDSTSHREWFGDFYPTFSRTCFRIPGSPSFFDMYSCACLGILIDLAPPQIGCQFALCGCSLRLILCQEHWIKDAQLRRASPRSFEGTDVGPANLRESQECQISDFGSVFFPDLPNHSNSNVGQFVGVFPLHRTGIHEGSAIQQIDTADRQTPRQNPAEAPTIPGSALQPQDSTSSLMSHHFGYAPRRSPAHSWANVGRPSAAPGDFDAEAVTWVPIPDLHEANPSGPFDHYNDSPNSGLRIALGEEDASRAVYYHHFDAARGASVPISPLEGPGSAALSYNDGYD